MSIFEKKAIDEEIRLEKWYADMTEKLPPCDDVVVKRDVPYSNDGDVRHTFDVYYQEPVEKRPVVFDFHGGGFISGDKKYNRWYAEELARQGFVVVTFAYPLALKVRLYDVLASCYEGMRCACERIAEFGGDADNIFLSGDSAGGFLATYLSAINSDEEMAKALGIQRVGLNIRAVGVISALFYCSKLDKNAIFLMRGMYLGKNCRKHPFWRYVNPENEVYKALPPIFGITSDGDFLQSYTTRFIRYMSAHGKKAGMYNYDNKSLEHDFVVLNPDLPESKDAIKRIVDYFKGV